MRTLLYVDDLLIACSSFEEASRARQIIEDMHRSLRLQADCSGSKIRHSASLSSQRSLQRLAPRLVTARYCGKSAMASTAPSSGNTSSVKGRRYPHLPLLAASVMVSRSAAAFSLPLSLAASAPLRQIASSRHRRTFRQPRGATAWSSTVRERWPSLR
jgi:hypothetical protein